MTKMVTYKKQGNGQDSWIIRYIENEIEVRPAEIVYEDPNKVNKSDQMVLGLIYEMSTDGIEELKKIISGEVLIQQRTKYNVDNPNEYISVMRQRKNWFLLVVNWLKRIFKSKK